MPRLCGASVVLIKTNVSRHDKKRLGAQQAFSVERPL
jgi:hypothetical protein